MCRGRVIIRKVGGITDSGIEGLGCTGTMIIGRPVGARIGRRQRKAKHPIKSRRRGETGCLEGFVLVGQ